MSILWKLVFFNRASSTHHKLALDALRFLRGPHADLWANLFLADHEQFLTGAKAPDNDFKDFKNHVLHVEDGFWGGATTAARQWYQKTVIALSQGEWPEAIYNAGVLSHYFTDPFQPFHTGQTEAEGKVHRAAEWSICKSYDQLQAILEQDLDGYPDYELPARPDWLEEAIRQGALTAHQSYDVSIDHYDLNRGIKDPPSGLDQELKDRLAQLIGLAVVGFARVLERAFEESAASPPDVAVSLHTLLAGMKMPLNWIRKKFTDIHERAVIEAIYLEIQDKGKVIESLPEDERLVRKLYAQEVLKVPVRQLDAEPARATGTQYGTGTPTRGEPIKPVSSSGFQRTVISQPRTFDIPRGPAAPLETCLMVPLAKEPPPDYVADAVVKAYLHQADQQPEVTAYRVPPAASTPAIPSPSTVVDRPSPGNRPTAVSPSKPVLSQATVPSKEELDREERRLGRRLSRPVDPEPVLPAPSLPVTTNSTKEMSLDLDLPADMFAPLPPQPRKSSRDVQIAEPAPVVAQPAKAVAPPTVSKLPATPAPVLTAPVAKSPVSQLPVSNVVPAPHIKLPQPVAEPTTAMPSQSRLPISRLAGDVEARAAGPSVPVRGPVQAAPIPPSTVPLVPAAVPARSSGPAVEKPESTASRRFYLELNSPIVDAPSIGPKTAERLESIGLLNVGQLLAADAGQAAAQLGNPAAAAVFRDWQDQARLVCAVPNLRGHDAQFLVACQVRTAPQLRTCEPRQLLQQVTGFLATSGGQRMLRGGTPPDLAEVTEWIVAARDARTLSQ